MRITLFDNITSKEKNETIEKLISYSLPSQVFFLMIILSVSMATFGVLLDSSTVVIGSMLIAPILYPILSCSMGIVMSDYKLIGHSLTTLLKAIVLAVLVSALAALFFTCSEGGLTSEIIARSQPSLLYLAIAFIAGLAVSFALVKPQLSETLPGVAISVAFIPPLAVISIGFARLDWLIISRATMLFLVNIMGIIFASMIIFSLMDFYVKKEVAQKVLKKEKKLIKDGKK